MPIQMFNWVSRPQDEFHINAAAAGVILLVMTLAMNGCGHRDTSAFSTTNPLVNYDDPGSITPAMKAEAKELSFYYGGTVQALKSISIGACRPTCHRAHRSFRLRQNDLPAVFEPHARSVSRKSVCWISVLYPDG